MGVGTSDAVVIKMAAVFREKDKKQAYWQIQMTVTDPTLFTEVFL